MSLYNLRNPAVKRLMKEAEELRHPTDEYHAQPLEDNLFEWHFTLRGPPNSDYDGGIYHGRITLPPDYPMKPPSIILLTPNGRFEINKKICLSISGHHPESWQPSWSIRTALLAIIGFMPTHGNGAIGSLDYTPEERKQLALKSQEWHCTECGAIKNIFLKKICQFGEDSPASSVQNSENDLNPPSCSSTVPNTDTVSEVSSKASSSEHSKPLVDDSSTAVCRRKITSSQDEADEPKPTTSNSPKSNRFYVVCTWLIVLVIIILCLRRLFSL